MRPRERLTGSAGYQRVFRRGLRLDGALFLLIAAENERGISRLGLAAGRRLGSAVRRNRAKRLLREAFRRNKPGSGPGLDLVLVAKGELAEAELAEVEREYRDRLRRVLSRQAGRGRPSAPAAH